MRHIICFGNPLHGDDGFGSEVYRRLMLLPLPCDVQVFDAGIAGLTALTLFGNCDEAIIVDAAQGHGQPGRVFRPALQQVIDEYDISGHGVGVGFLLKALAAMPEPMPTITILAAEVAESSAFRIGLSPAIELAVQESVTWLVAQYFES
jgi:hydrogenase maturation protease